MSLPLKWEFPGGKIEQNETPEECLIREIKEELDVTIEIIKRWPENVHTYSDKIICLIPFSAKIIEGDIKLREHAQYKWCSREQLLELDWAEADIPILKNFVRLNFTAIHAKKCRL